MHHVICSHSSRPTRMTDVETYNFGIIAMPRVYGSSKRVNSPYDTHAVPIPHALSRSKPQSVVCPESPRIGTSSRTPVRDQLSLDNFVLRPTAAVNVVQSRAGPSTNLAKGHVLPKYSQLQFGRKPMLRTCPACHMSFVGGGVQDEAAHRRHHRGVVSGITWDRGKGIAKSPLGIALQEIERVPAVSSVPQGRVYILNGQHGGVKLLEILAMVDTVLSAPPLPPSILKLCKVFLFVTSVGTSPERDRIAGVCVSQKIRWAMKVLEKEHRELKTSEDVSEAVECDPAPQPAMIGIHRIFTLPSLRRRGIAEELLAAACNNTIYGCKVRPDGGAVAFSQPTRSGKAIMDSWGKGAVMVFVDDESQNDA